MPRYRARPNRLKTWPLRAFKWHIQDDSHMRELRCHKCGKVIAKVERGSLIMKGCRHECKDCIDRQKFDAPSFFKGIFR